MRRRLPDYSSPQRPWSPKGRRRTVGPRLCLAVAWAAWTIKPTPNQNDEGPGFIPGPLLRENRVPVFIVGRGDRFLAFASARKYAGALLRGPHPPDEHRCNRPTCARSTFNQCCNESFVSEQARRKGDYGEEQFEGSPEEVGGSSFQEGGTRPRRSKGDDRI